jgi:hypothetical protein
MVASAVAFAEALRAGDAAAEHAAPERRVGDEADAELAAERQDLGLDVARPEGILGLQRCDRVRAMRTPQGLRPGLRKTEVAYLALLDVVDAQALEAALAGLHHVLGAAVDRHAAVGLARVAELGGHDISVAAVLEHAREQPLVRAVARTCRRCRGIPRRAPRRGAT